MLSQISLAIDEGTLQCLKARFHESPLLCKARDDRQSVFGMVIRVLLLPNFINLDTRICVDSQCNFKNLFQTCNSTRSTKVNIWLPLLLLPYKNTNIITSLARRSLKRTDAFPFCRYVLQ
ncbi:hypothetical protein IAQ61_011424 [Plenodomus lingam]|uniref:uncharacterized protein n=1 Tax=Leptosphaeria maculans TaxID=5022 RepID=UPI00331FF2E1|nr:hypothetical protein IAQ61_011424 [Plenodomus lingam]